MNDAGQSAKHVASEELLEELRGNLELQQLLTTMPDRTRHPVMVPVGSVAFFPGNLIHTNECLVDLGGGVTVEKSAKETIEFLRRRQTGLEARLGQLEKMQHSPSHLQQSTSSQAAAIMLPSQAKSSQPAEASDQVLDIMEPYDESIHGPLQRPAFKQSWTTPQHNLLNAQSNQTSSPPLPIQVGLESHRSHRHQQSQTVVAERAAAPPANSVDNAEASNAALLPQGLHSAAAQQGIAPQTARQPASAQLLPDPVSHQKPAQQSRLRTDEKQILAEDNRGPPGQQACATDDGDFERMMARFDDLAQQEAAADGVGAADPDAQQLAEQQQPSAAPNEETTAPRAASAQDTRQRKPASGLKRGFFAGALQTKSTTASLKTVASDANTGQNKERLENNGHQTAFTGEIIEKPDLDLQYMMPQKAAEPGPVSKSPGSSKHSLAKEPTLRATAPSKRVSKFKMARSAS